MQTKEVLSVMIAFQEVVILFEYCKAANAHFSFGYALLILSSVHILPSNSYFSYQRAYQGSPLQSMNLHIPVSPVEKLIFIQEL